MNGYEIIAKQYELLIANNQLPEEEKKLLVKEKDIYNALSRYSKEEIYCLFDSGAFNDIFKGYIDLITDLYLNRFNEKSKSKIRMAACRVLDEITAKEAENYHYRERKS